MARPTSASERRLTVLLLLALCAGCTPSATRDPVSHPDAGRCRRLLQATSAALQPADVSLESIARDPVVRLAVQEYQGRYPDPVIARLVWLAWWSSQPGTDRLPGPRWQAATVVPLLLEPADAGQLTRALSERQGQLVVYDPPYHQPDAGVLAVIAQAAPEALYAWYRPSGDFPHVPVLIAEQALSFLCADPVVPDDTLPLGLRLSPVAVDREQIRARWAALTLSVLGEETMEAAAEEPPPVRLIGRLLAPGAAGQYRALLAGLTASHPAAQHPALLASLTLWLEKETDRAAVRELAEVMRAIWPSSVLLSWGTPEAVRFDAALIAALTGEPVSVP